VYKDILVFTKILACLMLEDRCVGKVNMHISYLCLAPPSYALNLILSISGIHARICHLTTRTERPREHDCRNFFYFMVDDHEAAI